MNLRAILILIAVALGIALAVGGGLYFTQGHPIDYFMHSVDTGGTYKARRIEVIEGHVFDITLINGRRIEGRLDVVTPPQAVARVIKVLNNSRDPHVHIMSKEDYGWKVEVSLLIDDQRINLSDWLRQQGLVWDEI
tara:strand:- start:1248 stop:1655 length:408 start_codon:yes stop_codon:yes gene_type:complete